MAGSASLLPSGVVLVIFVLLDWIELEQRLMWELADFFILPKYRGGWIALEAVRQVIAQVAQPMAASTFKDNKLALRFFTAVSKRIRLDSVRAVEEEETSPFYTFIVNEPAAENRQVNNHSTSDLSLY